MKNKILLFVAGLFMLGVDGAIRGVAGISAVDTSYSILEFIWFSGVILILYGIGGAIVILVSGLISYDIRGRVELINMIVKSFKYIFNLKNKNKNKNKSKNKKDQKPSRYKRIILGIAILWGIGAVLGYI